MQRGLSTEGNLRFKLDRASLIVGSKFTIFFFVLLCIWGQFSKYKPLGGLYLEGRFNRGFFALPVWGAYIWRGLYLEGLIHGGAYFRNFTVFQCFTCIKWNLALIFIWNVRFRGGRVAKNCARRPLSCCFIQTVLFYLAVQKLGTNRFSAKLHVVKLITKNKTLIFLSAL